MTGRGAAAVLPADVRALVEVSAALAAAGAGACGAPGGDALEAALRRAAGAAAPADVEEVLLQSYLFLGYPAALNGLACWRRVSGRAAPPPGAEAPDAWPARGESVCRRVYGGQYGRLRENVRALHPEMERWMVEEGYGKVLGRPGPPLAVRELCIVALLAVAHAPTQLYSHLRGALNAGATEAEVRAALEAGMEEAGRAARDDARRAWRRLLERRRAGGNGGRVAGPSEGPEPRES